MKISSTLFVVCVLAWTVAARAADPAADREQQQVAALTKEVQAQQTAIVENQAKINEKVTAIAEALRQAKIYAARGR